MIIPVAEVKVAEIPALLNGVVQSLVEHLDEAAHVWKVFVHLVAGGKVFNHPLHEFGEAGVSQGLVVKGDQDGGNEVAHALEEEEENWFGL
jgi:hypothetical protein